jgi:hypothetical protein
MDDAEHFSYILRFSKMIRVANIERMNQIAGVISEKTGEVDVKASAALREQMMKLAPPWASN